MAADDLTRPLGRTSKATGRSFPLKRVAAATLGAMALVVAGWLIMVDDPDGGEPVAVIALDKAAPPAVDPTNVAAIAPSEPAALAAPEGPINPNEIIIRDASNSGNVRLFTEPVDGLLERTPHGLIPRVGSSGIRPIDAYARPDATASGAGGVRIAVVMTGLGLDDEATAAAVGRLPGPVSLAFSPYGADLGRWVARARDAGHEVLLELPPEGPHMLVAAAGSDTNIDNLHWLMSRMTNYAGVVGTMGMPFVTSEAALKPVIGDIGARGLLYLDDGAIEASMAPEVAAGATPVAVGDIRIDAEDGLEALQKDLTALEALADQRGFAIATVAATPMTIAALANWIERLRARGVELVPVTALARG